MTVALLCSGQGRQERSMLQRVATAPAAQPVLAAATTVLGNDPLRLLDELTDDELYANRIGQVLCVTRSLAAAAALLADAPAQDIVVTGYSVGEVAAWGVASVWSAADTLRLTEIRARAMDAASHEDGLGYVRGLSLSRVQALADQFACAIAIINPGDLFVLGGQRRDIDLLCAAALKEGAARAAAMPVRVASHTARLSAAVAPFAQALAATPMNRPTLQLLGSSDQRLVTHPAQAIQGLAQQLANPIDWAAVLNALVERGVERVLELGPGSALADMMRSAHPECVVRAMDDFETLAGARAWLFTEAST